MSPSHPLPDASTAAEGPAVLVSASLHRSGSTLVQRYLTASTDVFMWGETGRLVQGFREAWDSWPSEDHDLRNHHQVMADPSVVEGAFMPNLAPPPARLAEGLRASFMRIYGELPKGFRRWGWKDVGYGCREIELVRTLFPDLLLVLLVRNPWDVARSIRRKGWIDRRGYYQDVAEVARLWAERSRHYRRLAAGDDAHVRLLQYEHLDGRLVEVAEELGAEVRHAKSVWSRISGRTLGAAPALSRFRLTREDVDTIEGIAGEEAANFGYGTPS